MKLEKIIPKHVDPVELADRIKGNLSEEFVKRMKKLELKAPLVLKS